MHCPAGVSFFWTAQILTQGYHCSQMPYLGWNVNHLRSGFMKYFVFPTIGRTVTYHKGRDSVVGIVSPYGREGSGLEPRWWQEIFSSPHPHPSRAILEAPQLVRWAKGLFTMDKAAEIGVDRSPPSLSNSSIGRIITISPICVSSDMSNGHLYIYKTT